MRSSLTLTGAFLTRTGTRLRCTVALMPSPAFRTCERFRMVYRQAKPQGTLLKEFREHVVKGNGAKQIVDDILMPMAEVYEELTGFLVFKHRTRRGHQ